MIVRRRLFARKSAPSVRAFSQIARKFEGFRLSPLDPPHTDWATGQFGIEAPAHLTLGARPGERQAPLRRRRRMRHRDPIGGHVQVESIILPRKSRISRWRGSAIGESLPVELLTKSLVFPQRFGIGG